MKVKVKLRRLPTYRRILKQIEKEIEVHPNYADLHNQRGLLLMAEGDPIGAEMEFAHAVRLNPKYREAILHLGYLHIESKRWREAEKIFLSEAKKTPKQSFSKHLLGLINHQMGRRKEAPLTDEIAMREFGEIHLHRFYAQFYNFVGLYLAREGKLVQAIRELRKAARLIPDEFQFHSNLGSVYFYHGSYQGAIAEFKKALKIDPDYGMGYAYLSYVYGLLHRTREARKLMEKAVQLHPGYADLHYNLALLYSDQKRYKEAVSELKKAIRINPNYFFARINLGVLYEEQKKWRQAKREYQRILRITPEDEHVRKRLERILQE